MAGMYVIVDSGTDAETVHSDVVAVVFDKNGNLRLCRIGREDEYIEEGRIVCVVPHD